nr:MAG TPA: hypothetical protein [Bacteriophage sp.]
MADGNFNSFPVPYKLTADPDSKANASVTINGLDLTQNRVLKSGQFSYAMTGEYMLANLKYTTVNTWT